MTDETTKTGESLAKPPRPGTFKKGYDPRRNIRGVPKEAIAARKFFREVGAELLRFKDENGEGDITRLYAMVRAMFASRNPKDRELILKVSFPGLLKDEIEQHNTGETKQRIEIVYVDADTDAETTPSATADHAGAQAA
jgi:hypothetical protein